MAPMYANGYMYIFEQENILTPFQANIAFYRRFIDDIIMIWNGTPDSTTQMLETINHLDTPVLLTMTIDPYTVDFLDIRLYKEKKHHSLYSLQQANRQKYPLACNQPSSKASH
ncbi:Hypothetical predicted protein [Pelobates cultripes]|uniref:Reverse transcriptase domain-containing protein n=1 Tax=Pelobates cultripes TaxID=61616 RepID=A0AAD1WA34_PELCU|nr:Hypothetical predicted protein [Pelobates cultripes]